MIVGLFVLSRASRCLGYLAIKLGKLEVFGASGYIVVADFPSVAGLKPGDPVEIAGVKSAGWTPSGLPTTARGLSCGCNDGVKLQEDVIASVRARGLIGDKFVLITPGASEKIIAAGRQNPRNRLAAGYPGFDRQNCWRRSDLEREDDKKDELQK